MALQAVPTSHVPLLPENALCSSAPLPAPVELPLGHAPSSAFGPPKFMVIGHRGNGMNLLHSPDPRMTAFKENSIASFNAAAAFPIPYIEFDVQVTRDECPVIFHDIFILSQEGGTVSEKRITDLTLPQFLAYNHTTLLRKTKDGKIVSWTVQSDDSLCTLQDAFQKVNSSLGFNIELKFDDHIVYRLDHLTRLLLPILRVVSDYSSGRPVIFSTFQPDAARLVRKLQTVYPVFFLTDGGSEMYSDVRRNSLEEALKLCSESGLQGIVSEVKAVLRHPEMVSKIKDSNLSLLTYGKLNNVAEAVYMQHLMRVDGVIVDLVREITEAVSELIEPFKGGEGEEDRPQQQQKPQFSDRQLSFLLKLIPKLMQM